MHSGRQRVVISAAWGLGTGVVDGSVAADTAWVRRDGATEGFELEDWQVVEQVQQMVLGPNGGLTPALLPADRRRAASLPVSWLERVAQFCVAAEVLFGTPQDVEWAVADGQVWVLQSRPITALPPELSSAPNFPVTWADEAERRLAWVHYAYWRHVLRPLEVDYALDREAAQKESSHATGGQRYWRVKMANGRVYVAWAPNDLTPGERRVRRAALVDLKARLRRQDVTTWEHWGPEIIKATQRLSAFDLDSADGAQLADHLEEARGAMRRHMAIHGAPLSVSYQPLYEAYAAVSGLEGAAVADAADQLLEGQETTTTRLIDGLYALALSARQLPAVAALVADPPPDVGERLAALPQAAEFQRQMEDFLTAFGDRTGLGYGSDATIGMPSWREDPALVLRSAAPYLDPAVEAPAVARARAQAERQARIEALCEGCDDPQAVAEFRRQLDYARRAAVVMEEHNHYIDQLMNGQLRRAILAAALAGWWRAAR